MKNNIVTCRCSLTQVSLALQCLQHFVGPVLSRAPYTTNINVGERPEASFLKRYISQHCLTWIPYHLGHCLTYESPGNCHLRVPTIRYGYQNVQNFDANNFGFRPKVDILDFRVLFLKKVFPNGGTLAISRPSASLRGLPPPHPQ